MHSYANGVLLRKGFRSLKSNFNLYGLGTKVEKKLLGLADAHNKDWIKRTSFMKWNKWVKEIAIPTKNNKSAADGIIISSIEAYGLR